MPLRKEQIDEAENVQHLAAHDISDHVRVVAGPGTGKSATIEERVCWLLAEEHVPPACIVAVSFTRASTMDLEKRIAQARIDRGLADGDSVAVSTLHSLALRTLRRAGVLEAYPADPTVLEQWELRNIFDAEFGKTMGVGGVTRPEQVRRDYEAFWQTGEFDPPNVIPPDPPISDEERQKFNRFHGPRTQLYSCVLPGEVVARCVERMEAGTLDPAGLLGIGHLIIDEFQDLNPMDLRFVHGLAERGVRLFVAGDDDQSLYAFRYASPQGIEQFTRERPGSGDHTLHDCFRCAPKILDAAQNVIREYAADGRIEKNLVSLWAEADQPVPGALECWSFDSGRAEARAVAQSCQRLIEAGLEPSQIMILLSSKTTPGRDIQAALKEVEVPYAPVDEGRITDTEAGRVGYALLSVVVEPMNYVAHRSLLGLRQGVGLGTCNDVAKAVLANNRNYRDLFYSAVPDGLVTPRAKRAIGHTADVCAELANWGKDEALADRLDDICRLVDDIRAEEGTSEDLRAVLEQLPAEMSIDEARLFLSASKDDDRVRVLTAMAARLEQPEPDTSLVPERVQVMTMHGAKGLSAKVVFIPGLEEASLPGEKRRAYPGLVLEAARMLYVSITRARVACVLSHARTRFVNGANITRTVSRFTSAVGKPFSRRDQGIIAEVASKVVAQADRMEQPQDEEAAA